MNVICIAPKSSDMEFSYELTAVAGEKSVAVNALVELTPELVAKQAPKKNCLLVTDDIYYHTDTDTEEICSSWNSSYGN